MTLGRRLAPGARRAQLVTAGLELAETTPLDRLGAPEVAARAGVSKALVFHYFPSTAELHAAIVAAAAEELLATLPTDPALPPEERLRLGLDRYVASIERRPAAHLAVVRSAAHNSGLAAVVERTRNAVVEVIVEAIAPPQRPPVLHTIVRGWVALVEEAVLHWLEHHPVPREELVEVLQRVGLATLAAVLPPEPG